MLLIKTEAMVIRTQDYGETHQIITLLSKDYGKISVMARGAKKPKSRLSFVVQLFTYGQYMLYRGSTGKMGTLSQGEVIRSFRYLRQDVILTAHAAYMAEWVDKVADSEESGFDLFQMLYRTYEYLEEGKDADILTRLFELKMLIVAGFKPVLECCVICGRTEGIFTFSVQEGGFLCEHCAGQDPSSLTVQPVTLKILRLLYHFNLERLGEITVRPRIKEELQKTLWRFIDYHTPYRFKSRSFLEQLEHFMD